MQLLPSQVRDIKEALDRTPFGFSRADFTVGHIGPRAAVVYDEDASLQFTIDGVPGAYRIELSPGHLSSSEEMPAPGWGDVLDLLRSGLGFLKRELAVHEEAGSTTPTWVESTLPAEAEVLRDKIRALKKELTEISRFGELLWQTGTPLNRIVADLFTRLDYDSQPTSPGATYDVTVTLDGVPRRLLIEVTGIESYIDKGSKKISQVLQVNQNVATPSDKIVVVVNAHRSLHPSERKDKIIVTPDALRLLSGLGAVIVTTSQLYAIWELSRSDKQQARDRIETIYASAPGLFEDNADLVV